MKHNELVAPNGARKDRKRVGRGYSSGHGKTAGRGQKGQNSRAGGKVRVGFEGGQSPLILRMPYKRGFTNHAKTQYEIVNLGDLERVGVPSEVTPEVLVSLGLVDMRQSATYELRVKLLGNGEVTRPLTVQVHRASASARAKIEAAGGTLVEIEPSHEGAEGAE